VDIFTSIGDIDGCVRANELPKWEEAGVIVEEFLDRWLLDVVGMVADCAKQKIEVYTKYLAIYKSNKDKYRIKITEECLEKNTRYVEELTQRAAQIRMELAQKK
jgi:hypothetical protein